MSVKFGDSNIGATIGTPSLNAEITKPSINVNFNAPSLGASGGNTILRELVNPQFFIGVVETLDAGEDVYCYLTGTKDAPVLNFGIPMGFPGVDGKDGKDGKDGVDGKDGADGTDGVSPAVTVGTITGGHSVTITDADHPTGQTFNVMDGVDGQDGQDGVGVPSGGTTGQILKKKSNTDYDTEWGNESGAVTSVDGKTGAVSVLPTGGDATSSVLCKNSATDYDVRWRTVNDWIASGLCRTKGTNQIKYAEWSFWVAKNPSYVLVTFIYANSYAGALTLNINGTGACPIYINGEASSASNYTLPAGSYIGYFDGTNFYFRTDNMIPANIAGTAKEETLSITLSSANWALVSGETDVYYQTVTVTGGTAKTKVKLQPNYSILNQMLADGTLGLYIENDNATFKAIALKAAPTVNLTIQASKNETL